MSTTAIPEPRARQLRALTCHGTFEAHITVDAGPERREAFASLCAAMGVKCVLIELAAGSTPSQPMTASYHRGDLASVLGEIEGLHERLCRGGFPVVRVKLEAVANNAGVPITDEDAKSFSGAYFEFHAKLRLTASDLDLERLRELCLVHDAHLSRNDRKRDARGVTRDRFVTIRMHECGRTRATAAFERLLDSLKAAGYTVVGVKREFTIYDSRSSLDAGWLEPERTSADDER